MCLDFILESIQKQKKPATGFQVSLVMYNGCKTLFVAV